MICLRKFVWLFLQPIQSCLTGVLGWLASGACCEGGEGQGCKPQWRGSSWKQV